MNAQEFADAVAAEVARKAAELDIPLPFGETSAIYLDPLTRRTIVVTIHEPARAPYAPRLRIAPLCTTT